jgi:magnesium-transporting ATPase (P-type)
MKTSSQRFNERNEQKNLSKKHKIILSCIITLIPSFIWKETNGFGTEILPTIDFFGQTSFHNFSTFIAALIGLLITMLTFAFYPLIITFTFFRKNWFKFYLIFLLLYVLFESVYIYFRFKYS